MIPGQGLKKGSVEQKKDWVVNKRKCWFPVTTLSSLLRCLSIKQQLSGHEFLWWPLSGISHTIKLQHLLLLIDLTSEYVMPTVPPIKWCLTLLLWFWPYSSSFHLQPHHAFRAWWAQSLFPYTLGFLLESPNATLMTVLKQGCKIFETPSFQRQDLCFLPLESG